MSAAQVRADDGVFIWGVGARVGMRVTLLPGEGWGHALDLSPLLPGIVHGRVT